MSPVKLTSPRLWLFVAMGILLLVGVGIFWVIKNPPLPPGWTIQETANFRVAVPSTGDFTHFGDLRSGCAILHLPQNVHLSITSWDWRWKSLTGSEVAELDNYLERLRGPLKAEVISCQQITSHGHPAYVVNTIENGSPRKHLLVVAQGWFHDVCTDIAPGVLSEEDADFVFRSFRAR